jgi:Cu+-exporting ATPase
VAAAERGSEHPLAEAIVREAERRQLPVAEATRFEAVPGGGVRAAVAGRALLAGTARLLAAEGIDVGPFVNAAEELERAGRTPVLVAVDGVAAGLLGMADTLKPGARESVARLRGAGLEVWMITGDRPAVARAIGAEAGIDADRILAEVRPEEKAARVAALQAAGARVAMVGDGINDAPALAQADLGMAIGTGSDVAVEASDVTLIGDDVRGVPTAIRLSRATMRTIRQNLGWAFGYNLVLIPVAAGVFYPVTGWLLSPALAAGAMALSSVSVVTNSLRLRRFRAA